MVGKNDGRGCCRFDDEALMGHTVPIARKERAMVSGALPHSSFYSVQDPNQWNGNTHIQGGSPSVSLCGNTLPDMPRGVSSG